MNCAQPPSTTGAVIFCVILLVGFIWGMWLLKRGMDESHERGCRLRRMQANR
jgi:hypothetical protein